MWINCECFKLNKTLKWYFIGERITMGPEKNIIIVFSSSFIANAHE